MNSLQLLNQPKEKKGVSSYVKSTFYATYALLFTTGTITFIEALRTDIPEVRHIMNLETCISLVAGFYYSLFNTEIKDAEDKIKGYNLMDIGFNLATQTGSLGQAAGKTGKATLPGIIAREEGLRGRRGEVAKGLAEVAEGERLMKIGDITGGNAMFEKAQERITKEKVAGMKSPGELIAYANNYLASRRAAGDQRPDAIILNEGMDRLVGSRGAAAQRAATQAEVAGTNLYDKARDNLDSSLSKNYNSPDNKELRRLQKEDKKNKTNNANTYLQDLYRKEEQRLKGGQQTQSSPAPSGGESNKPKVINLDKI
jgi:hypothetical protein